MKRGDVDSFVTKLDKTLAKFMRKHSNHLPQQQPQQPLQQPLQQCGVSEVVHCVEDSDVLAHEDTRNVLDHHDDDHDHDHDDDL